MPKISIIIPVYNVENYIEQCIESVINQTLKDIEIIIVNDGTKDNSIKKIEKYLDDSRIVMINKENGGLSSARNAGLKIAKGEYIAFVDSDDFIEKTMLEKVYSKSKGKEIISFNSYNYDEISNKYTKSQKNLKNEKIVKTEGKGTYLCWQCGAVVWNKIYKREFLLKNNLFFKEGIIHEDNLFTIKSFFYANEVRYIDEYYYNYRVSRKDSIMNTLKTSLKEKRIFSLEKIIEELLEFKEEYKGNIFEEIYLELFIMGEKTVLGNIDIKNKFISKEEIKKLEEKIKQEWGNLQDIERKILKIQLQAVLKMRSYYNFSLFDSFYWKNKIITKKIFRRAIEEKIKHLFL